MGRKGTNLVLREWEEREERKDNKVSTTGAGNTLLPEIEMRTLNTFPYRSNKPDLISTASQTPGSKEPEKEKKTHLGLHVKLVVQVSVNFPVLPVFPQHASKDPLPPHPKDLGWHPRLGRSLPLSRSGVTSLGLGRVVVPYSTATVDNLGLDDDVTVVAESADAGGEKEGKERQLGIERGLT